MDLGFRGTTAVVQGGTQGMGRAAADCFAARQSEPLIAYTTAKAMVTSIDGGSDFS